MYYPSLEEVIKLKEQGNLVPIYREIKADLETPVSAFLKVARGTYSFLLESVERGEQLGRYSFIGTEPSLILRAGENSTIDPLLLVEREFSRFQPIKIPGLPRFHGGMVGYLGYEVSRYFEQLPCAPCDALGLPESVLMLADTILAFDHVTHKIKIISHIHLNGDIEVQYNQAVQKIERLVERLRQPLYPDDPPENPGVPAEVSSNLLKEDFESSVSEAKEHIFAGDVIQVVLSQRLAQPTDASPFAIYRSLRCVNPSPYMYYLQLGDFHIIGASPELLVRVEDGVVSTHPIAGTRPRGKNTAQDLELENELKTDEKERAEHIMLVDLGRNDIGRVS